MEQNMFGINLEIYINDCFNKWETETRFESNTNKIIENEYFQKIISLGEEATPFIINIIKETPSTLVWALNIIYNKKISNNPTTTVTEACNLWVKEYENNLTLKK